MLSVEQVIECDAFDYACYGGFPSGAFKYIQQAGGLAAETAYPYDVDGKTICLANQTFNVVSHTPSDDCRLACQSNALPSRPLNALSCLRSHDCAPRCVADVRPRHV